MTPISVNIGGTYREMSDGWVNINGTWRKVDSIYNNIGGTWREGYASFAFGPGSTTFVGGDMTEGFLGEVSTSEFITGEALASAVGITQGMNQYNIAWLKFAIDGNIIFVPKRNIRNDISWDTLNNAGCVYGQTTVVIGGLTYKVRLMKGARKDPAPFWEVPDNYAIGSEFNRLIPPIHVGAPSDWGSSGTYVASPTKDWGTNYTNDDIGLFSASLWCQESDGGLYRITRGSSVGIGRTRKDNKGTGIYWRPVLELVQP